jgi:hypothetical protein
VACTGGICGRALFRGPGSFAPCAAKSDGSLYCWGVNSSFQAGIGTNVPPSVLSPTPATVFPTMNLRYPASTGYVTCALLASDSVSCFGATSWGEVGNGTTSGPSMCPDMNGCYPTPVNVPIANVKELSGAGWWCGGSHFCARTGDRSVWCWGDEGDCSGSVGEPTPTHVLGIDNAVQIASGAGFNCALRTDGSVWCWGTSNGSGQLGQGDTQQHVSAVQVKGLTSVSLIGAGLFQACARAADGLYCWGENGSGQVGIGATDGKPVTSPTKVTAPGLDDVVQMVGSQVAACMLTAAGDVFCAGFVNGVGNGGMAGATCGTNACTPTPTKVLSGAVEIAAGDEFMLARLADGSLWAWGGNTSGELGNPSASNPQLAPIKLPNFP